MDRRSFSKQMLSAVVTYSLLDSLSAGNAFSKAIKPITDHWSINLSDYCQDLNKATISPAEWQLQVESLFRQIDLNELLKFIDFERLIKGFEYPDLGVSTRPVRFPRLDGLPEQTVFVKKIFGMKKDRAVIPHGHSNMASAHLVLSGDMHLRHYEKVAEEGDNLIVKPTIDKTVGPGECSSISDERDNIHWFIANSPTAFTLDVIMLDLKGEPYDIHNLDMFEKQDLSDGTMRVPVLDVAAALKKYGKETHH